ncbi:hypothetical protein RFI_05895, partial [Reticulomyxa filosa]
MNTFQAIPTGCYVCLGLLLAWNIPKYKDYFGVREEAIATLKLGVVCLAMYFFVYVVFRQQMDSFVKALVFTSTYFCVLFLMVMRSTWWVLRKQYPFIEAHLRKTNVRIAGLFVRQSNSSAFPHSHPPLSNGTVLDLTNVLKDLNGFELFMEHLFSGKFSYMHTCMYVYAYAVYVCMYAYTYAQLCIRKKKKKKKRICLRKFAMLFGIEPSDVEVAADPFGDQFVLSAGLPQSSIVNDEKLSDEQKVISLIEKYITTGAQYEVNLSYDMRMNY